MSTFIRAIKLERLTNGTFHELSRLALNAVEGLDDLSLHVFIANLKVLFAAFDTLMKQQYASALSRNLATFDVVRDRDFRFFRAFIKYTLKSRDKEAVASANFIDVIFRNYGDVAKISYPDETANMTNLIRDLRKEPAFTHIKNLAFAEEYLDMMEEHNNNFREVYDQRSDESMSIITGGTFESRKTLTTCLRNLVRALEATFLLGGSQDAKDAAKKIDKLFENAIREMSRRGNGSSPSKDDDNPPIDLSEMTAEDYFSDEDLENLSDKKEKKDEVDDEKKVDGKDKDDENEKNDNTHLYNK